MYCNTSPGQVSFIKLRALWIGPDTYNAAAVFSGLRTYALCDRHLGLPLGVLVFVLSSVPMGVTFVSRPVWLFDCVHVYIRFFRRRLVTVG